MKLKTVIYIVFPIVGIAIVLLNYPSWERNIASFQGIRRIDSGSKFGVEIGTSSLKADLKLKASGYIDVSDYLNKLNLKNTCHYYQYSPNQTIKLYQDQIRFGTVCLISKDGVVGTISWYYGGV